MRASCATRAEREWTCGESQGVPEGSKPPRKRLKNNLKRFNMINM